MAKMKHPRGHEPAGEPGLPPAPTAARVGVQTAAVSLRIGQAVDLQARVEVTPAGLLAVGGLVAGIMLSVAPLVWAARRPRT